MTDEVSQGVSSSETATAPAPQPATPVAAVSAAEPVASVEAASPAAEVSAAGVVSPAAVEQISGMVAVGVVGALTQAIMGDASEEKSAPAVQETTAAALPLPPSAPITKDRPLQTHTSAGAHMREVVRTRKQARLEKIMEMAVHKRVIVNDDVEMLLKVSDATATRYLTELVKAGHLKRSGAKFHEQYEPFGGSSSAI